MDIAALSMSMSLNQVQQSSQMAMMKKTMDLQQSTADALIQTMQQIPSFGHKMDIIA